MLGLVEGHAVVSIHTGSRGLGYQICEDHLRKMVKAAERYLASVRAQLGPILCGGCLWHTAGASDYEQVAELLARVDEAAELGAAKAGLITYRIDREGCEIMTLDSLFPGRGIGGALIEAVKDIAERKGCRRLWLVTTNDNLHALRFYQRKGFTLAALRTNVMEETRKRKPVPLLGFDGIPIRDEIELEMMLDQREDPS